MLCSLSFPARGTVWRILYLQEVESCTGGRESLRQALSSYNPAHWLAALCLLRAPSCHHASLPWRPLSLLQLWAKMKPSSYSFCQGCCWSSKRKSNAGRERGQGKGWGRRQGEERELGGGEAARSVFFYAVRASARLSVCPLALPTSFPFLGRLHSEMAQVSATKPDDQVPCLSPTRWKEENDFRP